MIGYTAGKDITTATGCTVVGHNSLITNQSGNNNTAIGINVMYQSTTGYNNTCMGVGAGAAITTAYSNTFIGINGGMSMTTGYNNTCIGLNSDVPSSSATNTVTLGDGNISNLRCADTSISSLSDKRDKKNITDLLEGIDFINKLRPVKFEWATREGLSAKDGKIRAGFIAQELQEAQTGSEYLDLVMDENPDKLEAKQGKLIPVLVKAIQELSAKVDKLENGS